MPPVILDLLILFFIGGLTWALSSEGLWGSALMFFNIVFAGLIAFNFYEPLAGMLAANVSFISNFADMLCLMAVFLVALTLLRLTTETIAPAMVRFPTAVYQVGRLLFSLAGALVTMAILLVAFEAAPVHKKVFTVMDYKYEPFFKLQLDREWLGFVQHSTGQIFADYTSPTRDPFGEFGNAKVFDPKGEWILNHQNARPYGTEFVLGDEAAAGVLLPEERAPRGSGRTPRRRRWWQKAGRSGRCRAGGRWGCRDSAVMRLQRGAGAAAANGRSSRSSRRTWSVVPTVC